MNITGDVSAKTYRKKLAEKGVFHTDEKLAKEIASYIPQSIIDACGKVYDPTCGCGALLSVFPDNVRKCGQEIDPDMVGYCKENLKNADDIYCADSLKKFCFAPGSFHAIVANYPFSIKWEPKDSEIIPFGCPCLPPQNRADFAFVFHILYMLANENAVASVLCSPGICYRGGREEKIRKFLVEQNVIDTLVLYEGDYFKDTKIATNLIVFRKDKKTTDIVFKDAQTGVSRTVSMDEIRKNDYNLSVNRYIERPKEPDENDGKPLSELQSDLMGLNLNAFRQSCELDWIMLTQLNGHDYQKEQFENYLKQVKEIADEYLEKLANLNTGEEQ